MKQVALLFMVICFVGCSNDKRNHPYGPIQPDSSPLISFVNNYSLAEENIKDEEGIDRRFKKRLTDKLKQGAIDSLKVNLEGIKELPQGKYAAHFSYAQNNLHFDVIGLIDDIKRLNDGIRYNISGSFIRFLNAEELDKYTKKNVWSTEIKYLGTFGISCGVILCKITRISL